MLGREGGWRGSLFRKSLFLKASPNPQPRPPVSLYTYRPFDLNGKVCELGVSSLRMMNLTYVDAEWLVS